MNGSKMTHTHGSLAGTIVTLGILLVATTMFAFSFQPAVAISIPLPNIYIKSNGTVTPSTAPIITTDNITYTFTDNILNYSLVIERSNIIIDGNRCTLERRPITGNWSLGMYLESIDNVTIKDINVKGFSVGIRLYQTTNIVVLANNITDNRMMGIETAECSKITIYRNNLTGNNYGVMLSYSPYSNITQNTFNGNEQALEVWGNGLMDFMVSVDSANLVNGKPVYYLENVRDPDINPSTYPSIGWLALINSTNITVENLTLTGNGMGLLMAYTSNSRIRHNSIISNGEGIWLRYSNNNAITENNIENIGSGVFLGGTSSNNTIALNTFTMNMAGIDIWESANNNIILGNTLRGNLYGVYFGIAENNKFFHNNFIDNLYQVTFELSPSPQVWDNGYPSGGNYWSDYSGNDTNDDAIGDTPCLIASNNTDRYPLIAPVSVFNAGTYDSQAYYVDVVSNSLITNLNFDPTRLLSQHLALMRKAQMTQMVSAE